MNITELKKLKQESNAEGIDPIVYFKGNLFWYTAKLSHISVNVLTENGTIVHIRVEDIRDGAEVDLESLTCDEQVVILDKLKTGSTVISLIDSAPYYYNGALLDRNLPWGKDT